MAIGVMPSSYWFRGTDRFQLIAPIGAGGMGVVFEAYDREHDCPVALKLLPSLASEAIARFKNEFRFLQGIYHPNLVSLGELIDHEGQLFFTMELVRGVDLLSYARHLEPAVRELRAAAGAEEPTQRASEPLARSCGARRCDSATPDEARVRAAFAQLTRGLLALHAHDKVHCDVKPSNVLVTGEGRAVLLDFGLVVDVARSFGHGDAIIAGTVSYMSPEQARGLRITPSCDWYSVGALLYETLTGRPPFEGSPEMVLRRKQLERPVPPSLLAAGVSEDLSRLCCSLLETNAQERPDGNEILSVLEPQVAGKTAVVRRRDGPSAPFVGRESDLVRLRAALHSVGDRPLVVVIEGESGVGKTALVREFLAPTALPSAARPLVLRARCSERELVPFKAFDPIIDPLAQHLARFAATRDGCRERYARALEDAALAFPMLLPFSASCSGERERTPRDHLANRHLAFRGIRELMTILAEKERVVLWIDDWQWADADSVALLSAMLAPPNAPPILLLLVRRPDHQAVDLPTRVERIQIDNLGPTDAEELARRLLVDGGKSASDSLAAAREIATESTGHPLFIAELVRQVLGGAAAGSSGPRLDDALFGRFVSLDPTSRRALELLAVARSPVPLAVLRDAMAYRGNPLSWPELPGFMASLCADNLARFEGLGGTDLADCFHDRVTMAILARLPSSEERLSHQALATVLERVHSTDFDSLAVHWQGAGDHDRAVGYAVLAGDRAMTALAFERATQHYRLCFELRPDGPDSAAVKEKLGHALSHLGRGRDAAEAFLEASRSAPIERKIELSRLAADQLLRSGYIDDAIDLIERVFHTLRLALPDSPRQALTWLGFRRLQLAVRGFRFRRRDAATIPAPALARTDACWSVAVGLSTVDNLRGAYLQSRHLLMALELGEPYRILRALAVEAGYRATVGLSAVRRVDRLFALADGLAKDLNDPYAFGFTHLSRGLGLFLRADWPNSRRACEAAEAIFEGRPIMASWELASARMFLHWSLFFVGELGIIRRRVPELIVEAEARGDLYAATCFRLGLSNLAWLIADEPEQAQHNLEEADRRWSVRGMHLQHYWSMLAWVHLDLYRGRPQPAYARIERIWPRLRRALLLRIESLRIEVYWLRARAALALAQEDPNRRRALLLEATRCARVLASERPEWAKTVSRLVMAGVFNMEGDPARMRGALQAALEAAERCGLVIVAGVAQRCLGLADGAAAGADDVIVRPDRWAALFAPGVSAAG